MLSAMIGGSFTTMAFQGLQIPIIIIIIIIIICETFIKIVIKQLFLSVVH